MLAIGGRSARACAAGGKLSWRVALIDSCGSWPGAIDAAAFESEGARGGDPEGEGHVVVRREVVADPTGHGTRIAELLCQDRAFELLLGQVFTRAVLTSSAAVAAAVDWALSRRVDLIHLSLGLASDRAVLAAAVLRALEASCIIIAATPARGRVAYPAAYPGVIRATSDARCAPGELSCLGAWYFGGCPGERHSGGSSVGAAWVTHAILDGPAPSPARTAESAAAGGVSALTVAALTARAKYFGAERRTSVQIPR